MEIGVVFPQIEIGEDPKMIKKFAKKIEDLGFEHILIYDHVLGVDPNRPGWDGSFDIDDQFHEPLTLYSFLAGITNSVDLITGILILPQRQTALVAKQSAEVDLLSEGRFRIGIGVGWNKYEYIGLNKNFNNRGERIEEQVVVLRKLWTNRLVDYKGKFHNIPELGINPLPKQKPIPIWMGGMAEPVIERTAKIADGWFPQVTPGEEARDLINKLNKYIEKHNRNPSDVGIHGRMKVHKGKEDEWIDVVEGWDKLGANHLSAYTMHQGLDPIDQINLLESFISTIKETGLI